MKCLLQVTHRVRGINYKCNVFSQWKHDHKYLAIFYLGFLSQTFTNHRAAGERGGHFFKSSLHFHSLHTHVDISRAITVENSSLHIAYKNAILEMSYIHIHRGGYSFWQTLLNKMFHLSCTRKGLKQLSNVPNSHPFCVFLSPRLVNTSMLS